jgi:hypothetical protein
MNRTEAKELLPVITAFANGEQIEFRIAGEGWRLASEPIFSTHYEYRIAPKPKTCERWYFAVFYPDGDNGIYEYDQREHAEEVLIRFKNDYRDATFSRIVRVEFVEDVS